MESSRTSQSDSARSTRTPLGERQPRTRQSSVQSKVSDGSKSGTPSRIPHHESMYPEGNLSVLSRLDVPSPRAVHDRVSALAEDDIGGNKRDSQTSTTSTASTGKAKRKTHIGPWQLGRTLGKGATGRVRLAKHAFTGQSAAIKIVSKKSAAMVQSASMRQMDYDTTVSSNIGGRRTMPFGIEREIVIMKLIEHPHVVSLYDIWENRGELYLVLEFVEGGELFDYVMRNGALPESEAVRLLRQLIAGLSYCHRFNICHRDLKPENILLDDNLNIKIADFGMAALQPIGQYLTTSCGSPHYAAPEIIAGRQYQGNMSDIWSVGIILYAMLNGFLPFDGGDLNSTLAQVRKGEYYLSPNLSVEAADLIQRILQKRPENRIPMAEIWRHPLLRKYEKIHSTMVAPGKLAGPPPPLTAADCGPRRIRPSDIDRELLRNLQILWHGLGEEDVIKRLISDEPNHEKLFYWALIRFREEQLENYPGDPLQHSASDYHHLKKPSMRLPKSTTRSSMHSRKPSISQFSVVSAESIGRPAYYKVPASAASKNTQASYDPYRASRIGISQAQNQATTVVVRRSGSRASAQHLPSSRSPQDLSDTISPVPEMPVLTAGELQKGIQQKRATYSTVSSFSSLASSQRQRAFRKSTSYRRNVLFQHQWRRSSQNTEPGKQHSSKGSSSRSVTRDSNQTFLDSRSTPSMPTPQHVTKPKRPASDLDLYGTRVTQTPWRDDAPHVSVELSKICEEAFNRSSLSCASEVSQPQLMDSPATTVSIPEAPVPKLGKGQSMTLTPTLRDLLERRQRIIDTWGDADLATLADVVATLDRRILEEQQIHETKAERRAASDPMNDRNHSQADIGPKTLATNNRVSDLRAVSAPAQCDDNTIRMVTPDPTSPMTRKTPRQSKASPVNSLKGGPRDDRRSYDRRLVVGQFLEPIIEDPIRSPRKQQQQATEAKKWSWLSKKNASVTDGPPITPLRNDSPEATHTASGAIHSGNTADTRATVAVLEENEARKRTWFQKVFKRKDNQLPVDTDHQVLPGVDDDESDELAELFTPARRGDRHSSRPQPQAEPLPASPASQTEVSQNWFAKFLHLKPASRVIIMRASKAQARKEVVKILREWRKFGIRDVAVEKRPTGDVVRARVDAANCKSYYHDSIMDRCTNLAQICISDQFSSLRLYTPCWNAASKSIFLLLNLLRRKGLQAVLIE